MKIAEEISQAHAKTVPRLPKPAFKMTCNSCGYCCTSQPCSLAVEFLKCKHGPCCALEAKDGKLLCGLVRNPLGYLFKAARPEADVDVLGDAPISEAGQELSTRLASALGLGMGCDAEDDEESAGWGFRPGGMPQV